MRLRVEVWDFRCQGRCDNRWTTNETSLNFALWEMESQGWSFRWESGIGVSDVYCPEHQEEAPAKQVWVECSNCDWEEDFPSQEDAEYAVSEHNKGCFNDYHVNDFCDAKIVTEETLEKRKRRYEEIRQKSEEASRERAAYERYVAFLVEQDQLRRARRAPSLARRARDRRASVRRT